MRLDYLLYGVSYPAYHLIKEYRSFLQKRANFTFFTYIAVDILILESL